MKTYYHVTRSENLNSIKLKGLVPQERVSDAQPWVTTKRIYLQEEPDYSGFYGNVLLQVTIPPKVRVMQSMYSEGFYVTSSIPPNYIKILEILK